MQPLPRQRRPRRPPVLREAAAPLPALALMLILPGCAGPPRSWAFTCPRAESTVTYDDGRTLTFTHTDPANTAICLAPESEGANAKASILSGDRHVEIGGSELGNFARAVDAHLDALPCPEEVLDLRGRGKAGDRQQREGREDWAPDHAVLPCFEPRQQSPAAARSPSPRVNRKRKPHTRSRKAVP